MKLVIITICIFFLFLNRPSKCQDEELGGTREIYTWTLNTGTTFRLQAIAPIWGHSFELATKYCNATLEDTTITVPSNYSLYLIGWDNVVLPCSQTNTYPYFGYTLYKVSIGGNRFIFYFDTRDDDYDGTYPCGNDFYFKYDYTNNSLQISTSGPCITINAVNGEHYSIWEINEKTLPPTTNSFEDYWQNCLVLIPTTNNHPRLVWGPHPTFSATNYKLYRAISDHPANPLSLTYSLIATTSQGTYEYTDLDALLNGDSYYAYYYVKAYRTSPSPNYSEASNYINTVADFEFNKPISNINLIPEENILFQNYPNPFNPTTKISYSIKEEGLVTLKVYAVLGKEVATLLNENKPAGNYEFEFNASELPSGMYIYKIQAGQFSDVKKMILTK